MILTGPEIEQQWQEGKLTIDPFIPANIGPNSYDVTLGPVLKVCFKEPLDTRKPPIEYTHFVIPEAGFRLEPGYLYLAATEETIGSDWFLPDISGKSTLGRFGLNVHHTAGWGDVGFHGTFTLELSCVQPVIIYSGMKIAQVRFSEVKGQIVRYKGHYQNQKGPRGPVV